MAKQVLLKHKDAKIIKKGFYGFSWTLFFFTFFAPAIRGDWKTAFLIFFLTPPTAGILSIVYWFIWNKKYTLGLLEQGYEFCDTEEIVGEAKTRLGIAIE